MENHVGLAEKGGQGAPLGPAECMLGNAGDTAFERAFRVSIVEVLTAGALLA